MKKILVALLASAACCTAHAAKWHVVVTAGYLTNQQKFIDSIPVLDTVVENDGCYYGTVRNVQTAQKVVPTREQFCVKGPEMKRVITATVFVKNQVNDALDTSIAVDLNAGLDIFASFDGRHISFLSGPYLVTVTKETMP
ncbi:hypothetical protein [Paraburkholderia fungorum]|uniref:Uncharacterized protein n=1 Tax=Paraburkholderia fungorum TaxID=134537 RepID=A0AAW3V3H1_9BURK|nr:hypothetical protein [Paraburkholderia fungorum]MBB4517379.1 hypothetical protein [Paraburkholderia fungorum]MBB6204447.1 hypothetical protein [Paraburkholderia fungorum]